MDKKDNTRSEWNYAIERYLQEEPIECGILMPSSQCYILVIHIFTGTARCTCHGDPHCHSFDGAVIHHYGACTYTLVRDGCVNGTVTGMWLSTIFHLTIPNICIVWSLKLAILELI